MATTHQRRRLPAIPAGYDDLTVLFGVVGVALALIGTTAMAGLAVGLVGGACAIAAHENGRHHKEEADHPTRLWLGTGLSALAVTLGLLDAIASLWSLLTLVR